MVPEHENTTDGATINTLVNQPYKYGFITDIE